MWTQIIINHLIIHYDGLYLKILLSLQPHHFYLQPIVYCEKTTAIAVCNNVILCVVAVASSNILYF